MNPKDHAIPTGFVAATLAEMRGEPHEIDLTTLGGITPDAVIVDDLDGLGDPERDAERASFAAIYSNSATLRAAIASEQLAAMIGRPDTTALDLSPVRSIIVDTAVKLADELLARLAVQS